MIDRNLGRNKSMAFPFLDHTVVDHAAGIPPDRKNMKDNTRMMIAGIIVDY